MESEYINDCLLIPSTDGTHLGHVISLSALASYAELLGASDTAEAVELVEAMAGKRAEGLDSPSFWQPLFADYRGRNGGCAGDGANVEPMAVKASAAALSPAQVHARQLLGFDTGSAVGMFKASAEPARKAFPDGLESAVETARSRFRAEITRPHTKGGIE